MSKKKVTAVEKAAQELKQATLELEKAMGKMAHEQKLEHARKLLTKAGFVQGPGDTWTSASMGKRGGQARAKNLTKEQLSKIGKQGAAKRWKKGGRS